MDINANTGVRITAYAAALAATFGIAYGVGTGTDPVVAEKPPPAKHEREHAAGTGSDTGKEAGREADGSAGEGAAKPAAGGLQISDGGYRLALEKTAIAAGARTQLKFSIKDGHDRNLISYKREHEKELHFIVASRDLTVFRHLHPVRAGDGVWSIPVELPKAGDYRVFADFTPGGAGGVEEKGEAHGDGGHAAAATNLTLGADLAVSGPYEPSALPPVRATAEVDGYQVALDGELTPGKASDIKLTVSKDGRPVTNLQPYLGAYGHLVALRAGDLAYLHVHPDGRSGARVSFGATAPSDGAYRLFFDFRHEGEVRTAAFTVRTGGH
ncbi:hypothetical protein [Streptomyces sp. NBC_01716]|uniref:hypothetical protein n=1 Tax=Streptomyces sp. NBC_01716 TaxID=2975917 RepID=UPI002E37A959|nr:hypothetical protein [Streptomyces sp. NBC_01716]